MEPVRRVHGALLAPLGIMLLIVALTPGPVRHLVAGDLGLYLDDGGRLLAGSMPYRGFAFEYPPLALVPMTLPLAAWPFGALDEGMFAWLFAIAEGILAIAAGLLVSRVRDRPAGAATAWVLLVLAAGPSIAWRFDLWPAVLVLASVVAADRGRPGLAGIALGTGVMAKLFPAVVLPILAARFIALRDRAGLGRLLLGCALPIGLVMGGAYALAGAASLQWLTYLIDRGLQLESVGAGLVALLHVAVGLPASVGPAFGALQVTSPGSDALVAVGLWAQLALLAGVTVAAVVRFRHDVARRGAVPLSSLAALSVAAVVALLLTSKVFSVQYVVWLLPLVPLLGWPMRGLAIAIAALSTLIHPLNYAALMTLDPVMTVVLNVRNLLLVALLVQAVRAPAGGLGRRRAVARRQARAGFGPNTRDEPRHGLTA